MTTAAPKDPSSAQAGTVVCTDIPDPARHDAIQAALEHSDRAVTLIDKLDRASGGGDVVIVYTPPAEALAHALQNGQAVAAALAAWTARSEGVLKFLRRNRRRTQLVPDGAFLETPATWLGGDGSAGKTDEGPEGLPRPDGLYLLLAQEALRRDRSARKLAEELEASSVFAEDDPPELDLDAVRADQTQALQRLAALQDEFAAVQEEQEAVLRELVVVQEKAAGARDAHLTAERLEKQLRQDLKNTEAKLLEAQGDKGRLESESRDLSARIEELATNLNAARQAEGQLRTQNADLQTELEAARAARDKRDQELGKLTELLTRREGELHDLSTRHEAETRAQAEALEASQAALHDATRDLQAREQALAELQTVKKTRDQELGKLTARLKRREDDLAKMYASRSYRITRPFRLLRAALRKGS